MILSIIIPMFKVEVFIKTCLESCVKQDLSSVDYEIICVNDGSPDQSAVLAREFADQYSNIKVIDRPNGGLSAARNTGLSLAKGEYVWFVDSDDWIVEDCIGRIVKRLQETQPDMLQIQYHQR